VQIKLVFGEREAPLGCEALESLVGNLPDDDQSLAGLFGELARSNIAGVRAAVARKSAISAETVASLASDPSPEVIEALVNDQCRKLSEPAVARIIQRDWSAVNRGIAGSVEDYDHSDVSALAKLLAHNGDPSVRAALASNRGSPKAIVRQLLRDPDADVRRSAQTALGSREIRMPDLISRRETDPVRAFEGDPPPADQALEPNASVQIKLMFDEREVPIGCEALASLVESLPDEDESLIDLFDALARSSAAVVRAAVARKSAISEETVANFASDSSPEVIGALVNAQCRKLSESAIVQIVQRNWSAVNRDIAHNVESFDQSDTTALAKLLAGSADPSVRAALASNSGSPKVVVRQFLNDPDPDVRRLARNTLKR